MEIYDQKNPIIKPFVNEGLTSFKKDLVKNSFVLSVQTKATCSTGGTYSPSFIFQSLLPFELQELRSVIFYSNVFRPALQKTPQYVNYISQLNPPNGLFTNGQSNAIANFTLDPDTYSYANQTFLSNNSLSQYHTKGVYYSQASSMLLTATWNETPFSFLAGDLLSYSAQLFFDRIK